MRYAPGFGQDVLLGLRAGQSVEFDRSLLRDFADLQAHAVNEGGSTRITLASGESLLIGGIAPEQLSAANFTFTAEERYIAYINSPGEYGLSAPGGLTLLRSYIFGEAEINLSLADAGNGTIRVNSGSYWDIYLYGTSHNIVYLENQGRTNVSVVGGGAFTNASENVIYANGQTAYIGQDSIFSTDVIVVYVGAGYTFFGQSRGAATIIGGAGEENIATNNSGLIDVFNFDPNIDKLAFYDGPASSTPHTTQFDLSYFQEGANTVIHNNVTNGNIILENFLVENITANIFVPYV